MIAAICAAIAVHLCVGQVPATERTAERPDSWLVLYNSNVPDSVAWAAWYSSLWGIPQEQLLGLDASTDEHLADAAAAEAQVFGPVRTYLTMRPDIEARIMGIVVGYRVPGHFGTVPYGCGGISVANALQDPEDTTLSINPDYPHRFGNVLPLQGRLTKSRMSAKHYMVARIDGPDLAAAKMLSRRAKWLWSAGAVLPGQWVYHDYQDAQMGTWAWLKRAVEYPSLAGLPWRAFDDDTEQTPSDAFRFGWHDVRNWTDARLRGLPAGPRILAYNLNSWGATTVRSTTAEEGRYVPNAIQAGYAAAIGSTGEPVTTNAPYVDTLLAGLMSGWTLGECFYLSNPYDDLTWTLVGDPLLRVPDWSPPPTHVAADFDVDGDVDMADFTLLQQCFTGPTPTVPLCCVRVDLDCDDDVDLNDLARLQTCFNGPNQPPRCAR